MKIFVNRQIATEMILEFANKVQGKPFTLAELKPIDVYAFVLADTFMHVDEALHDVNIALDRAIERADRLGEDNFTAFVAEHKDEVIDWR